MCLLLALGYREETSVLVMVKPVVARADVLVDNLADNLLSDCLHETRISDTRLIDGFLAPPRLSCLNAFPKLLWF